MFRAFGHERVSVLNGGRTKWAAESRAMTKSVPDHPPAAFYVRAAPRLKTKAEMRANIDAPAFQVLDARGQGRFEGSEPEPRPGLRSGHIPGSLNLPFLQLIDADTKVWRDTDVIRERFVAAGVDLSRPLATTCGSGVSACTLALGAHLFGKSDVAIYDGSWIDWGSDATVPVVTGSAKQAS
jgi:thiosulfate/3-mercaptopyruvate sulfurtransferase